MKGKTGLVLEGGAMRFLFSSAILDVFLEEDISFDGMVGVSAGSGFGCNFRSRQKGRAYRYNLKYCQDPRYFSMKSLLTTGDLFNADFCYHELPEVLDPFDWDTYYANPMHFSVVVTSLATGCAEYFFADHRKKESTLTLIRASASMPMVSNIVHFQGEEYLDGGIADAIPLSYFQSVGYDRNVVILTQPRDYVKKERKISYPIRMRYRKYPKFLSALKTRHVMYNAQLEYIREQEKMGTTLVLAPKEPLRIRHAERDRDTIRQVYEKGRLLAIERLAEVKEFLHADR